ncbi:uncharacterized protein LOC110238188 [Exaiptasia diaphana]|uniref:WSC domain-containing protein n=1 Tax=Exaiptasia diaphana TaxID=2652724 RepID=A0A913X605_EXADI|nr:uncharacterized protein LOC110238188 [Exaiptasia diaphana]
MAVLTSALILSLASLIHTSNLECHTIRYFKAGCFADYSHDRTMEEYHGSHSIEDCMRLSSSKGYKAFGIQYGNECWTGAKAHLNYRKHGTHNNCANGKGGSWSNYVYIVDDE